MSLKYGFDGFVYWHYWFGNGYKTLEKVKEMYLSDLSIKQNFFFAWANLDWTKSWVGDDSTLIFKQVYSENSALDHFEYLQPFIEDSRYIKLDNKPIFQVINPESHGVKRHIEVLEREAVKKYGYGFHWIFPADRSIVGYEKLDISRVGYAPCDVTVKDTKFRIKSNLQKPGLIKGPLIIS